MRFLLLIIFVSASFIMNAEDGKQPRVYSLGFPDGTIMPNEIVLIDTDQDGEYDYYLLIMIGQWGYRFIYREGEINYQDPWISLPLEDNYIAEVEEKDCEDGGNTLYEIKIYTVDMNQLTHKMYNDCAIGKSVFFIDGVYGKLNGTLVEHTTDTYAIGIFPNPCHNIINIDVSKVESRIFGLSIFDMHGKTVYSEKIGLKKKIIPVSSSDLINGHYYVVLKTAKSQIVKKIIINN